MINSVLSVLLSLALVTPAEKPLTLSIYQTMGMAPLTLRVKVRAAVEGKEVCVVVDGPDYHKACRTLSGVTWTQDFMLYIDGEYEVFAVTEGYRTAETIVKVIGLNEGN